MFDGEITGHMRHTTRLSSLVTALSRLKTMRSIGVFIGNRTVDTFPVAVDPTKPICSTNELTSVVISLDGPIGNLPRLTLLSSVQLGNSIPAILDTSLLDDALKITSNDGRDDSVKECNGAGVCNYMTGLCDCDHGYEFDSDMGPCGRIVVNTSDWHGLARCPGVVSNDEYRVDWSNHLNREFMYVSMNWRDSNYQNNLYDNKTVIERYAYGSSKDNAPYIRDGDGIVVATLTSNISAGPLLIDRAKDHLYFVDQNPAAPFIGRLNMTYNGTVDSLNSYQIWLALTDQIVGFAMDAHFNRRRIYWTHRGTYSEADGIIAWASLDATQPTIHDITAAIGQPSVVDPSGIAVHVPRQRIFWLDMDKSKQPFATVLRSATLTGGDVMDIYLYRYERFLICIFTIF